MYFIHIFQSDIRDEAESFSITVLLPEALYLQLMLLLCLVLSGKSELCSKFSLHEFVLSSVVSQKISFRIKPFKKSAKSFAKT